MAVESSVRDTRWVDGLDLTPWERETQRLALEGFRPERIARRDQFPSRPWWTQLRALGTRLWLDTGDLEEARALWTREFTNLTTNNTLVNKEVQKGIFDDVIREAGERLNAVSSELNGQQLVYEVGFILNCREALRLVEALDATVSVELHPGMAHDIEASERYGKRYYAVCPERFIIKVPLTPDGLLAARRLFDAGIPVNFTLGFSARQNVLAAHLARPSYVNVFMGRLNAFVSDNGLGDGRFVGEKATLSTQRAIRRVRKERGWETPLLIGASMRDASQVETLAGLDVFTLPTKVAADFQAKAEKEPVSLQDGIELDFEITLKPGVDRRRTGLDALWDIEESVTRLVQRLEGTEIARLKGSELVALAEEVGCRMLRRWSPEERAVLEADGKIPVYAHWEAGLASGEIALDDLMSQSALHSFITDQRALDERIERLLKG